MKPDIYEQYEAAWSKVRGCLTTLDEITLQDYPDPAKMILRPTKYQVDMMAGLALALDALIDEHERR